AFHDRAVYGVPVPAPPEVALPTIGGRTRHVCALLQDVTATHIAERGIGYIQGTARLGRNRTVIVTTAAGQEQVLTARTILVATGSRPLRPRNIPFDDPDVYDSDDIFKPGRMPTATLIVG